MLIPLTIANSIKIIEKKIKNVFKKTKDSRKLTKCHHKTKTKVH